MHSIQMILKDNGPGTEMETAKALHSLQKDYGSIFGDRIRPNSWGNGNFQRSSLDYRGHLCCTYDVSIIFNLDKSGVLRKNVAAFYVFYPEVFKSIYYDVGYVMGKIDRESVERNVTSGLNSLFEKN